MQKNGFIKVSSITPKMEVGNPLYNIKEIINSLKNLNSSIAVFPELCITGYSCGDLFYQSTLIDDSIVALNNFLSLNTFPGVVVLGMPLEHNGSLYNCAVVIKKNEILGVVPKRSLPNSREYYEKRWFKSAATLKETRIYILNHSYPFGNIIFRDNDNNIHLGIEICEDMWSTITPSSLMAINGANVILNLSASNEVFGKSIIRRNAVLESSRRNCGAYIYTSAGVNESSSETVFSGHNIIAQCGVLLNESERFSQETDILTCDIDIDRINFERRNNTNLHDDIGIDFNYQDINFTLDCCDNYVFDSVFDITPFVPKKDIEVAFKKISSLQEYALVKRIKHVNSKAVVIGISGGLDSTLALLIAYQSIKHLNRDPKDIIAVTMPGFGTSSRTKNNATILMEKLGVTILEMPISESVLQHFKLINHNPKIIDLTYENSQARIRTLILMDLATKYKGFVLGTGDMSELALGWCTYNGDQMSMYGINCGIPKTLVKFLIKSYAEFCYVHLKDVLLDIVDTPISPELTGIDQKTEDSIGKYEINDFILYRYLFCGDSIKRIKFILYQAFHSLSMDELDSYADNFFKRFFAMQFKRQALPDGPKILSMSLGPRSDYRMPSDIKR